MTGRLWELAAIFLRLGASSFGGPAVHIAQMEAEFVRQRAWLSRQEFLDLVSACNLIPGPNSTEMALHIGLKRAGWRGLLVAGFCFILPAFLLVLGLAWAYQAYGSLPQGEALLRGVKPVVIAVIVQALWSLGRSTLKSLEAAVLGGLCLVAALYGLREVAILLAAGAAMTAYRGYAAKGPLLGASALITGTSAAGMPLAVLAPPGWGALFWVFFKAGACLFGSGYVLLAFLRSDLVLIHGWLSEAQLVDAAAIGQVTPGPVFTMATFIGYLVAGPGAALLCTVAIFLPAFVLVPLSAPWIGAARRSAAASAFLDGVNAASLALMAAVLLSLAGPALGSARGALWALLSVGLLLVARVNSAWLLGAGAVLGILGVL